MRGAMGMVMWYGEGGWCRWGRRPEAARAGNGTSSNAKGRSISSARKAARELCGRRRRRRAHDAGRTVQLKRRKQLAVSEGGAVWSTRDESAQSVWADSLRHSRGLAIAPAVQLLGQVPNLPSG